MSPRPDRPPRAASAWLVRHIIEHHHARERRALPYITSLLPKIAARHRGRDDRLDELCDAGEDLAEALQTYMDEEEHRLLPALAAGGSDLARGELSRHNEEIRLLLSQVRSLASGYRAPEWSDVSYRALMEELEELEDHLLDRLHIEKHALLENAS